MADASDSKSDEGDLVWVQVPPSAWWISAFLSIYADIVHW